MATDPNELEALDTREVEAIAHNALAELERRRVINLRPRRVHQKGAIVALDTELVATPAGPDDPRPKGERVTGSSYVGALACPDCGRGLRGTDDGGQACARLPGQITTKACHPGCLVACGEVAGA